MGWFDDVGGGLGDLASTLFGGGSDQFGVGGLDVSGLTDAGTRAAPSGGGWWDTFGNVAKSVLPFAQVAGAGAQLGLGAMAANQLASQTKLAEGASKRQASVGSAAEGFGKASLDRASSGAIQPAIQSQIDNWAKGAKQQARAKAAAMGQGDSTMLAQWEAWIDQQAQAMQAGYLQQEEKVGLEALGIASSSANAGGGNPSQQQGSLEAMIAEANRVMARLSQGAA